MVPKFEWCAQTQDPPSDAAVMPQDVHLYTPRADGKLDILHDDLITPDGLPSDDSVIGPDVRIAQVTAIPRDMMSKEKSGVSGWFCQVPREKLPASMWPPMVEEGQIGIKAYHSIRTMYLSFCNQWFLSLCGMAPPVGRCFQANARDDFYNEDCHVYGYVTEALPCSLKACGGTLYTIDDVCALRTNGGLIRTEHKPFGLHQGIQRLCNEYNTYCKYDLHPGNVGFRTRNAKAEYPITDLQIIDCGLAGNPSLNLIKEWNLATPQERRGAIQAFDSVNPHQDVWELVGDLVDHPIHLSIPRRNGETIWTPPTMDDRRDRGWEI